MAHMATSHMHFSWEQSSTCFAKSTVIVDKTITEPIATHVAQLYQNYSALPGYENKKLPLEYTKSYFAAEISQDCQEFIYKHFVIQFLLEQLTANHIITANWPRLAEITTSEGAITYHFILTVAPTLTLKEWKHFVFKQPERKNYKDLDNQVIHFMKQATDTARHQDKTIIEPGDWIYFALALVDPATQEQDVPLTTHYWIKMSGDVVLSNLQAEFLHKKINDAFIVSSLPFAHALQSSIEEPYHYHITVKFIAKGAHLSLEFFKNTFKLKTRADIHKKLIEVFSYRNDISQRRSTIEELFHLLFTKHRFEIPKHIITRKKEVLLSTIKKQSDYNVYKSNKQFEANLSMLAEKMLKEELIIDHIACEEKIAITMLDVAHYLHLFNNERLKEFIYFKPFIDSIEESTVPLHEGILAQAVIREKTLNYILYTLS
jgi:FKBP-type peptidyl-prolyl cis-trans isomerase (trigger factor)